MNHVEPMTKIIKLDFNVKVKLCDYSDAYVLVKGNVAIRNTAAQGQTNNATNKKNI